MPALFYPEGNTTKPGDDELRTLHKLSNQGVLGASESGGGAIPLTLPTHDEALGSQFASTTHLDVEYVPTGWNGYRYWMVHTPYPDAIREDPNILCSNDGVTWIVPPGGVNPVSAVGEAIVLLGAGSHHADADIVLLADNRMAIYYAAGIGPGTGGTLSPDTWAFVRKTSTDGINWSSPPTPVLTGVDPYGVSPTMVVHSINDVDMWYIRSGGLSNVTADINTDFITYPGGGHTLEDGDAVYFTAGTPPTGIALNVVYYARDSTATTHKVALTPGGVAINLTGSNGSGIQAYTGGRTYFRTSTDGGVTFGAEQNCTFPKCADLRPDFHHLDVVKVGDTYHCLMLSKTVYEGSLWYYKSKDRLTWTLEATSRAVPKSGHFADSAGHYRGCLVPKEGGLFDVYAPGVPHGFAQEGIDWPTAAMTATDATDIISSVRPHFLANDDPVSFDNTLGNITANIEYYVRDRNSSGFKVAATPGGVAINLGSDGTLNRIPNPWLGILFRNVQLPMEPHVLENAVMFPPTNAHSGAPAAWDGAGNGYCVSFTVQKTMKLRYAVLYIGVASGNIEVAVLRPKETDRLTVTPLVKSGVIPCPTAGVGIIDLGYFTLIPGEYWLWLWADNTTFQTPFVAIGYVNTSVMAFANAATGISPLGIQLVNGGRALAHFHLRGDAQVWV